jgi:anhydro-N-acetylmuramic acid kinase
MSFYFQKVQKKKLIINIGGISNGTHLSDKGINIASDIGPGNCLLDYAASKIVNIDFDKGGKIASRGKINKKLFEELINNFPENIYPRSDDLEVYTEYFFKNFENFKKIPPNDLFRTLTEVTAEMIFKFFVFCERPEKIIFHGGGTLNSFLMKRIEQKIGKKLHTTDDFGVPSKYVESAGFAYLAYKKRSEIFFPK